MSGAPRWCKLQPHPRWVGTWLLMRTTCKRQRLSLLPPVVSAEMLNPSVMRTQVGAGQCDVAKRGSGQKCTNFQSTGNHVEIDHFYGTHAHACTYTRLFPFGLWTVKWHVGPSSKKCPLSQALPGLPDHRCIPCSGKRGHFLLGPASAEGLSQAGHHILGHGWFVHSVSKSSLKAGLFAHSFIPSLRCLALF